MKYQITIAEPCNENWNKMTLTQKGKFCKSCSKEVIDFTQLTNSEVSKRVLNQDNLCGRFNESQLDKEIKTIQKNSLSKIAASLALVSTISASQPILSQFKKDSIEIQNMNKDKVFIKNDSVEKFIEIRGKVKDSLEVLPGANIVLKGTKIAVQSDFDGNFSIKIPNKKRKSHILVISYLGFKKQEVNLISIKKPLIVELKEDNSILGGISIVSGMVTIDKKPNIFKRTMNIFRKKENKR